MLEVLNLCFDYEESSLLKNINLQLSTGGLIHVRGGNGRGKTTLLKLIAGLYTPTQGEILFLKRNIETDVAFYQSNLCLVGHKTGINPYLSLRENCQFDLHFSKSKLTLTELARVFNLEAFLDIPCGFLSAGQKRQIGLLRLWMTEAKLWLLDEPLIALDSPALALVINKIEAHQREGGAVLLTSHQALPLNHRDYEEYFL